MLLHFFKSKNNLVIQIDAEKLTFFVCNAYMIVTNKIIKSISKNCLHEGVIYNITEIKTVIAQTVKELKLRKPTTIICIPTLQKNVNTISKQHYVQ